jgi:PhnB protein
VTERRATSVSLLLPHCALRASLRRVAGTITPYLAYEDTNAAIEFLSSAFGFRERLRYEDEGKVTHAELELGGDSVFLGFPGPDYRNPKRLGGSTVSVHVYVDDVDAHYAHAKAAGAEITAEPTDEEYGDRRYDAVDPEGHRWHFAQRLREVAPEDWGAQTA